MSKRFGRNQRRKMREEIAAAKAAHDHVSEKLAKSQREYDELSVRLHRWAQDVLDLIGKDSAFNEAIHHIELENLRDMGGVMNFSRPAPLLGPYDKKPVYFDPGTVIQALIYTAHLDADIVTRMREQIRVSIESRNGKYAVAISNDREWTSRDVDVFSRMIAREISEYRRQTMAGGKHIATAEKHG